MYQCIYHKDVSFNQKINQELQEALEDKEGLKQQVQEYILEVRRIEDVLSSKVKLSLFL